MMNWHELPWSLLVGIFWQTYALSFYLTVVVLWLKPYGDNIDWQGRKKSTDPALRIPYLRKFIVGIFGLLGACGSAALMGTFRDQIPGEDIAGLIGFPVGIGVALLMRKGLRLKESSDSSNISH
jgi:hypothetical protein